MAIIGREQGADIVLPFPQISARHAVVEPDGSGRFHVRDLGSANGTFLNGKRIVEGYATPSDDLRFGSVIFEWSKFLPKLQSLNAETGGFTIGRDAHNDIRVPDPRVSGTHARVIPQGNVLVLIDLGSSNGISVNGHRFSRGPISRGDRVCFGSLQVDLFGLLQARGFISAPVSTGPPLPQPPQKVAQKPPQPPAQRTLSKTSQSSDKSMKWIGIAAGVVLVLGAVFAFIFLTREEIVRKCENCEKEIFHEHAFLWDKDSAIQRASTYRWCTRCGDEPIAFRRTTKCSHCGKVTRVDNLTAPRRTEPKDIDFQEGYCSSECQLAEEAGKMIDKAGGLLDGLNPFK